MTTFFLVRHGSCGGLGETLWGRTPGVRLNEAGKAQALNLAEQFAGMTLDAIYSSPLERALETAETIARVARLDVKQSPAFNEIDFGEWSGRSFELLARDERWQRFNSRRSVTKIPGGESFLEVQARVVAELLRLSQQHPAGRVVIVSHADVIKAAVAYVVGTPIDLLQRFEILPCSVSVIATDEHETKLLALNSPYRIDVKCG